MSILQIEMRKDIDAAEDAKDIFEKDLSAAKAMLEEADEEKKRLQGENEMLKALMKKEVDRLDSELAAKANVVDEYKRVVKQLSQKVDAAERRARVAEGGGTNYGTFLFSHLHHGFSSDNVTFSFDVSKAILMSIYVQGKQRHRRRMEARRHRDPRLYPTTKPALCRVWGLPTPGSGSSNWNLPRRSWPSWRRSARIRTSLTRFDNCLCDCGLQE